MPVNISTIPKKRATKSKKQEETSRVYKKNNSGPDPNAPQPPSPDSDATDNDVEIESSVALATATATNATVPAASSVATSSIVASNATACDETSTPKSKKMKKDSSYDRLEVNKLLSDLFPSKYMNEKVKALESNATSNTSATAKPSTKSSTKKKTTENDDAIAQAIIANAFSATDEPITPPVSSALTSPPKAPKKASSSSASKKKQKQNFNIIIHVEPKPKDDETASPKDDISRRLDFGKKKKLAPAPAPAPAPETEVFEDDDDSDEDYIPEDTDSSSYDEDDEYFDEDDEFYEDDDSYYSSSSSESEEEDENMEEMEAKQKKCMDEIAMMQSLRTTYEEMLNKDKTNRIVAKQLKTLKESEEKIKRELEELTHRHKRKNSKKFRKLLRRKSSTNDLEYFKKHLTIKEQRALIDELAAVAKVTAIEKPYKLTLLESDIPRDMKAVALRKVGMLQYMEPGCGEYCKLKNWVDAFMQIPFNKNKNLPITIADGVERCHEFMTDAKTRLDTAVYGLNDAKMQIMQMVGQWIANPAAIGTAVAIHGPPGTGKTSLVKEGISKILGRDFAFIALGGATDSSFLEGHSYTYEGSMWGKIVDILIRCKSSNPVIYFDELDKISETSKGDEIVGILTHLTDTSQNSQFHDKYFSEVGFDLSKCLFIFSYNDESRVNPVLLDRMYKIKTTGYSTKDKTYIAQHHLIPRIRAEVAFAEGDIVIPDAVIEYIVENHTQKESGVRNLKRCLETVYTKLNLHRLMRPGTKLFDEKEKSLEVSFPYTVSQDVVDKLIKKNDSDRPNMSLYL
jgi:hypothetical protein